MNLPLVLLAGIVATSAMTAFSYAISLFGKTQFKEPQLLNILISRSLMFSLELHKTSSCGWILHYLIGWGFIGIFDLVWRFTTLEPNLITGAILGIFAGTIGVAGWKMMFLLNRNEPELAFGRFYLQLLPAHLIFGICAAAIYRVYFL